MSRLAGRTALVTGGSSGIGLAIAERFVDEGAFVYITGRRHAELNQAAASIGRNVRALQGDVAKPEELDRIYAAIGSEQASLDIVVANAGVGTLEPLGRITEAAVDQVLGVNLKGTIFTVQKGLPLMRAGGSIILLGSSAGSRGTPAFSVYSASKAAIRNLARSWALDLSGTGIRVNVLSPGATLTPALERIAAQAGDRDAMHAGFVARTPIGRISAPSEVAAVAAFLASDDSLVLTGGEVFADGGLAQV